MIFAALLTTLNLGLSNAQAQGHINPSDITETSKVTYEWAKREFCEGDAQKALCQFAPYKSKYTLFDNNNLSGFRALEARSNPSKNYPPIQNLPVADIQQTTVRLAAAAELDRTTLDELKSTVFLRYDQIFQSNSLDRVFSFACGDSGKEVNAALTSRESLKSKKFDLSSLPQGARPAFICPGILIHLFSQKDGRPDYKDLAGRLALSFTIGHESGHALFKTGEFYAPYLSCLGEKNSSFSPLHANEAIADLWGRKTLVETLKAAKVDPRTALQSTANAASVFCDDMNLWGDAHPPSNFRVNQILATDPELRALIGCTSSRGVTRKSPTNCDLRGKTP